MLVFWIAASLASLVVLAGFVSGRVAARADRQRRGARGVDLAAEYHIPGWKTRADVAAGISHGSVIDSLGFAGYRLQDVQHFPAERT